MELAWTSPRRSRRSGVSRAAAGGAALCAALVMISPRDAWSGTAVPIPVTGWNQDLIFEAAATSFISEYFVTQEISSFAETGTVAGVSVNGFPAGPARTFTAPSGATFQLQPCNQNSTCLPPSGFSRRRHLPI